MYGFNGYGVHVVPLPRPMVGACGPLYGSDGYQETVAPPPATKIRSPSEFILMADAAADGCRDFMIQALACRPIPDEYLLTVGKVHRGGANVLFADGHVQWYLQSDMI